ncbi:GNAT family N-acyltransferase [Sulfitobacter albidus]|uniref:GNAT family N-acyltransferase n=1 Tax=Sulfitobacter albidus TaxID=2829501 RepID=UPI0032AE8CDF
MLWPGGRAEDAFDAGARHLTITDRQSGAVVCTCRLTTVTGAAILQTYTAQFYGVDALAQRGGR